MKILLTLFTLFLTVGYLAQTKEEPVPEMECPVADDIECINMPPMFITAAFITK
jgi:hypothetical protein